MGRGGSEQRIPAHKFVLSVGSAVFDAMFNSTLATQEDEITIPDVEPAAFLATLKFLYSDEVGYPYYPLSILILDIFMTLAYTVTL